MAWLRTILRARWLLNVLDSARLSQTRRSARLPFSDVRCLSVSPASSEVALGSENGTIYILDMEAQAVVYEIEAHEDAINAIVFSQDGSRFASASDDETACIWDAALRERGQTVEFLDHGDPNLTLCMERPSGHA